MTHGLRTGVGLLLLLAPVGCSSAEKIGKESKPPLPLPSKLPSPTVGTPTAARPDPGIQQVAATSPLPTTPTSPPAATVTRTPDPLPLPNAGGIGSPTFAANPAVMTPQPIAAPATLPPPVATPETSPLVTPTIAPATPAAPAFVHPSLGVPPADPRTQPAIKPAAVVQPPTPMTDPIPPMPLPPDPLPLPTLQK